MRYMMYMVIKFLYRISLKYAKIEFLSDCEVKKGYGWKIIFMCNTDWKSGGHYATGITHFKRSRSDRSVGYQKFHPSAESF